MELQEYLGIVWRRKWLIVLTLTASIAVAALVVQQITPSYTATSTLRLATSTRGSIGWDGVLYAERLMNTYARMATSNQMRALLQQEFPSIQGPTIDAEIIADTEFIVINVQHADPQLAQTMANRLAAILVNQSRIQDRSTQAYPLVIADSAIVPITPSSPRIPLTLALAALVGLIGGLGMAFLVEGFDTRLYTLSHIHQATKLPMLTGIPRTHQARHWKPARDGSVLLQEVFRQLRGDIFLASQLPQPRSLLVTSAEPREGKTIIAANLAISVAHTGKRVVLVDCNLRQSDLHQIFELANTTGVADILQRDVRLSAIVQPSGTPGLHIITSGPLPENPTELLMTDRTQTLLAELLHRYDVVILDTAAGGVVADVYSVAGLVDGVLLVVERQRARASSVQATRERLKRAGAHVLGVVVNNAEIDQHIDYYPRSEGQPSIPTVEPVRHRQEAEEMR